MNAQKILKSKYVILFSVFAAVIILGVPLITHAGIATNAAKFVLAYIGYSVLWLTSWLVWLAGQFFNYMVEFALVTSRPMFTDDNSVVLVGWKICRDVANMFFIFVILYIGIATILRLPGRTYKQLLLGIIIAALLVNFSLPITRVIIDFSNVMAVEFLCRATGSAGNSCDASKISDYLMQGLGNQTLFSEKNGSINTRLDLEQIVLISLFGSILMLVTAFVLFAGAILLLVRTVVLMFLAILSPLAFLFMVLWGKAKGMSDQWWGSLFGQAFFAPIFMFFLYLIIAMINYTQTNNLFGARDASFVQLLGAGTAPFAQQNIGIFVQYIVITGMLILSLISAQQMGAYGASGMISLGKGLRKRATGAVGRVSKRAGLAIGAGASKRLSEGKGKISGALRKMRIDKIPGITRAGARMETARGAYLEKKIADEEKKMGGASEATLQRVVGMKFVSDEKQAAAANLLAKRNQLESGSKEDEAGRVQWQKNMENVSETLKRAGRSPREIDDRKYQWAANKIDQQEALKKASPTTIKAILADEDLRKRYITEDNYETMHKSFNAEKFRAMYESGTAESEKFMQSLGGLAKSTEELAQEFEKMENRSAAAWARGTGQAMAKGYVGEPKKEEKESESKIIKPASQWSK